MEHILDEQYKGHELSYYRDASYIAVDIRADDYDGDIIGAYTALLTVSEARSKAVGFVEGWQASIETVQASGSIA